MYYYCLLDRRFQEVVLLLKKWNKANFTEASTRLNSFTYSLMVLALFIRLQILPCLQDKVTTKQFVELDRYRGHDNYTKSKFDISFKSVWEIKKTFKPENEHLTVFDLVLKFFSFYGRMDP
mmetsp:Transcript_42271/g.40495  ORF Transcript_42271/g.40495 Transcript_42271/m.40495 type:complete len:121 (+) Transcript_42271:175-537(+)